MTGVPGSERGHGVTGVTGVTGLTGATGVAGLTGLRSIRTNSCGRRYGSQIEVCTNGLRGPFNLCVYLFSWKLTSIK